MSALNSPQFKDPEAARQHLEALRWPNGPICPHCGTVGGHYALKGKAHRPGLWKCKDCREQFSVTVGTVFERSKIKLNVWLQAVFLLCSSKKGMSSHQLHRTLGVTYKTAWFMSHRIREAFRNGKALPMGGKGGIVEADETYWGRQPGHRAKQGGSGRHKVVSLVSRTGESRSYHVAQVNKENVSAILAAQIAKDSKLFTDTASYYRHLPKDMFQSHKMVNHSAGEYARGEVHTNTVEGYFGLLKRGLFGTYHHISEAHLQRYLHEFDFRFSNRVSQGVNDDQRTATALKQIGGKRLTYRRINGQVAQ
jgi:transposase-like protein